MRWRGLQELGYRYLDIRSLLPATLQKMVDRFTPIQPPTRKQLAEIEILGERFGLNRKEVYAAVGPPFDNAQLTKRRITPLSAFIFILFIIILGIVYLVLTGYFLNPPHIYGAGTRYGSIKPQDFISD